MGRAPQEQQQRPFCIMSYGRAAGGMSILGAMVGTCILSKINHNLVIGSGEQPTTICDEFKAGAILRGLAKPMESNPDRRMMQNPVRNTSMDFETGRSPKYMYQNGDPIISDA